MRVVKVSIPRPLLGFYYYKIPEHLETLAVGSWVKVPFGRAETVAYVLESPQNLESVNLGFDPGKLKEISAWGTDQDSVPLEVIKLCQWASDYYQTPLGEVLQVALPRLIASHSKSKKNKTESFKQQDPQGIRELTADQTAAVNELIQRGVGTTLLEGVTGSGKTEVYIEVARHFLTKKKGVLFLVPEISLTPQFHQRLSSALGVEIGLWHSAISEGQRKKTWERIRSGELQAVVAARSGVFSPVKNLGLIVVDEEHDTTYKQEERVRYHARDLAIVRAMHAKGLVILGSATPSLESLERAREGKYQKINLKKRFQLKHTPQIELVDLSVEKMVDGIQNPLAEKTILAIQETIAAGEQVMVFLNRRGFASYLLCEDCGEVAGCGYCSISMTVHKRPPELVCHQCGSRENIPVICSKCQGYHLKALGFGTESLESELQALVPAMMPARLDRDQITSATRLHKILKDFELGVTNTLLGTQMLVKGHDFAKVTLVVVVLADSLFRWPDFRAAEKAYQILTQVSGRSGRGEFPGRVFIQTYCPEHPVNQVAVGNVTATEFLDQERELRELLCYPPFGRLARIRFEHAEASVALKQAVSVGELFKNLTVAEGGLECLGPSPAAIERLKGKYRFDLLLRTKQIELLQRALFRAREFGRQEKISFLVDVDPMSLG